jgi:GntR family transcriptional repressor for pyruvate dehydrogenase complex
MFTPIKNTKVYEQVIEQIKEMIVNGTLKKGDKLPSERELSLTLNISRASIREALRSLEIIGLVQSRQGEGNFISDNFDNLLLEPLSMIFMLNNCDSLEILELREAIEMETAVLATDKVKEQDIEELSEIADKIKTCVNEGERVKYDKEFHYKIAKISNNVLIINILNTLSSLMDRFIQDAREKILTAVENKDIINEQHEEIIFAMKNKDRELARIAMKQHIQLIKDNLSKK